MTVTFSSSLELRLPSSVGVRGGDKGDPPFSARVSLSPPYVVPVQNNKGEGERKQEFVHKKREKIIDT